MQELRIPAASEQRPMSQPVLQFGGEETFHVPPQRLFDLLTDPTAIQRLIPDLEQARQHDDVLEAVVRPGFSFLRGTLQLKISFIERRPPGEASMRVEGRGIGTSLEMLARLHITETNEGCRLEWSADVVRLQGLIATVSKPLIRAAADQVIRKTWDEVRTLLHQSPDAPPRSP